jgi:hypothetical protein
LNEKEVSLEARDTVKNPTTILCYFERSTFCVVCDKLLFGLRRERMLRSLGLAVKNKEFLTDRPDVGTTESRWQFTSLMLVLIVLSWKAFSIPRRPFDPLLYTSNTCRAMASQTPLQSEKAEK